MDPERLVAWMDEMPRRLRGTLIVVQMALLAVAFDFGGRFYAFPIARIAFARKVTRRRLAAIRFVVLSAILALIGAGSLLAPKTFPLPSGWVRLAFFGVLTAPIVLSVVE